MFCRYSQKGEEMQTAAPQSRGPTHAFLPQHPSKTSPSTITKVLSVFPHICTGLVFQRLTSHL